MADKDGYTHASRRQLDLGIEDFLGLDHHLPFFGRISILKEIAAMWDDVEGDLLGKLLRLRTVADKYVAALFEQFVHALFARARHRLVCRYDNAGNLGVIV